jgi:hypothetical protein
MAFDVNFLVDAHRNKAKILEIPIEWEDSEGSKVSSIKTSVAMALSIIRLRAMYSPLRIFYPALDPIGELILKLLGNKKI